MNSKNTQSEVTSPDEALAKLNIELAKAGLPALVSLDDTLREWETFDQLPTAEQRDELELEFADDEPDDTGATQSYAANIGARFAGEDMARASIFSARANHIRNVDPDGARRLELAAATYAERAHDKANQVRDRVAQCTAAGYEIEIGTKEKGWLLRIEGMPFARRLSDLKRATPDDGNEILRHRFLCRGGGALLVGPTGIGKSSFSMQCAIAWALGREAFGIIPARPLKSLFIQAENDDGDMAEMRDGVVNGIGLTSEQVTQACKNIFIESEDSHSGPQFFPLVLAPLLAAHKPDVVWLDPANAYLGGDTNAQKDVGPWLRNGLNPLLHEHDCAAIVVHHTAKPNANTEWTASQLSYMGGGSAEWANWPRAVLVIEGSGTHGVFRLHAPKRGNRLGWRQADGQTPSFTKIIRHAKEPGVICWQELTGDDATAVTTKAGKRQYIVEDVLAHVPVTGTVGKAALLNKLQANGMGLNRTRGLIAEAVESGRLFEWQTKRPGTRPTVSLSRTPQPTDQQGDIHTADVHGQNQPLITS